VIKSPDFAYTCAAILLMSAVFFAAMLYLPQLMINVLGYSPIGAGAGMLPMMATFAAVSFVAGNLYNKFGAKPLLILGSACIAVGPALIALLADREAYGALIPGMAILGLGIGLFYPTATTVAVTGVDESRRSLAGAIIYMFQIAGGSVGLGLTTTVFIGASDGATGGAKFIDGIQTAFGMDAAIAVGGFLIAAFLIGGRAHLPHIHRPALAGHSPRGHGP
jgi:MFS family permease